MKRILSKWLLTFCLIMLAGHVYAQQRYYCEVKGIEKKGELKVSICDDKGRYVVYELDGKTGGARFFKVTVGENDYGDYLAGRDPDVSAGIEETPFDPHKYECLLEELSEFFV